MATRPFHSARLKVERANQHISNIQDALQRLIEKYQDPVTVEPDGESGKRFLQIAVLRAEIDGFALLAGDAIHNLRTALDHAAWELMKRYDGKNNNCAFPTGADSAKFVAACDRVPTPRRDARQTLVSFDAYPGGKGEALNTLTLLDNVDKHRLLIDLQKAATIPVITGFNPDGSRKIEPLTIFSPTGEAKIIARQIHMERDAKITLDILIGPIEPAHYEPIVPTLAKLVKAVDGAIEVLEAFVAANP